MFLGTFKFLSTRLAYNEVITGANFTNQYGEVAWLKIDGVPHRQWESAVQDLTSRGWKFTGVTTTKVKAVPSMGYRTRAAYLRS